MPVLSISPFFLFGLLSLCSFVSSFSSVFPTFFFFALFTRLGKKNKRKIRTKETAMTFLCLTAPFFSSGVVCFPLKRCSFFFLVYWVLWQRSFFVCFHYSLLYSSFFFLSGFSHLFLDLFLSTVCFPLLYLKDLAKWKEEKNTLTAHRKARSVLRTWKRCNKIKRWRQWWCRKVCLS